MDIVTLNKAMQSGGAKVKIHVIDSGCILPFVTNVPFRGESVSTQTSGSLTPGSKVKIDYSPTRPHGSMMCSTAHAQAPEAEIFSYNALPDGVREYVCEALAYIFSVAKSDSEHKHIVTMSLSGEGDLNSKAATTMHDLIKQLDALGVLVVVAAGNDGGERLNKYPSCFEEPVTVSALNNDGTLANFSTWHNEVDFCDLGKNVPCLDMDGKATVCDGTSPATQVVGGKLAAMWSKNLKLTANQVYEHAKSNIQDLGTTGRDPYFGWGWIKSTSLNELVAPINEPKIPEKEENTTARPTLKSIAPYAYDENVLYAQTRLIVHGFSVTADGKFGPLSEAAVIAFQKANNLLANGIIDEATWAALDANPKTSTSDETPTSSRVSEFVPYLDGQIGSAYVWGAQGHLIDFATGNVTRNGKLVNSDYTKWVKSAETSTDNAARALKFIASRKAAGVKALYCYDCSGLAVHWLLDQKKYITSDMSSSSLYAACTKITRSELQAGDFVFRADDNDQIHHIGYVARVTKGVPTIVESYGRDLGVVSRPINASGADYWNRYGRYPVLQISDDNSDSASDKVTNPIPFYAVCNGNKVNVRSAPLVADGNIITQVIKDGLMLAMPAVNGWCAVLTFVDNKPISGYMSQTYVKAV